MYLATNPLNFVTFLFQPLIPNELSTSATIFQLGPCNLYKSKSSPWNFERLYLLNRSSESSDSCAHAFVAMSRSLRYCLFSL
jgi:hypothetical protein